MLPVFKEARMLRFVSVSSLISRVTSALLFVLLTAATAGAQAKPRIAVMNFENNSTWSFWGDNLGKAAADELVTNLVNGGTFTVIERAQLESVMAEQRLGASGAVSAATAAKVGKILGVQFVLTGSITAFSIKTIRAGFGGIGGSYSNAETKLDVRLISTETAEILAAMVGQGNKRMGGGSIRGVGAEQTFDQGVASEALRPAVEQVVQKIVAQSSKLTAAMPQAPTGQVVGAKGGQYYINRGESAGVKVGQRFTVSRVTDEIKDADGTVLDRVVANVGVLEVVTVLGSSSICKLVSGAAAQNDTVK
jgi:curli biogenesis system outer membrane secretion channel CsgG